MKKSKTDKLNVYNFGIPAFLSSTGLMTCRQAGECAKGCYAQMGSYAWSPTKNAYENRLKASQQANFPELVQKEINSKRRITHVRIHDSGDFYSASYLSKWMKIARDNPNIVFYCYTKEVEMFKKYAKFLPSNFVYIFSYGGKQDYLIDPKKDRHSKVFSDKVGVDYVDATNDDLLAIGQNKMIGLVYHGYKSKNWGRK